MILRAFRYALAPTAEQEEAFRQFAGVCRLVYNLALEQREVFWRQYRAIEGKHISFASQCLDLTALRAEIPWAAAVYSTCQEQALRDLDSAYANFFSKRAGYPTPRRKGVHESFRFKGREMSVRKLNGKWSAVRVPKIGWVKFRDTRPIHGKIKAATIALTALGWQIAFACEIEHETPTHTGPSVGIDRGIANTIALSTGERMSVPASLKRIERRHRSAQRAVHRCRRGSIRYAKAVQRAHKLKARMSRIRRDWHHKVALTIAGRFGAVVIEDLNISNMTSAGAGKRGLNRSILNQGWGLFESILGYKLEERGGTLVKVDPDYTSQCCSECGTIDRRSRESQASFACVACGFQAHADHNAAMNILRRNTASMRTEDGRWPADEVRTVHPGILPGGC